jgi:hypothetical protein
MSLDCALENARKRLIPKMWHTDIFMIPGETAASSLTAGPGLGDPGSPLEMEFYPAAHLQKLLHMRNAQPVRILHLKCRSPAWSG